MAYGRLEVYFPDGRLETYMLEKDLISVGRAQGNDIALDTDTISRYHFSLVHNGQTVSITDLASANGTFVDGVQLTENQAHLLGDVEEILVGDLRVIFRLVDDNTNDKAKKTTTTRRIFISYKSEERSIAMEVQKQLSNFGHSVWIDTQGLKDKSGHKWWDDVILPEIRKADIVIALVSQRYLTSLPCQSEIVYASKCRRSILSVQMSRDVDMSLLPSEIKEFQFVRPIFEQQREWYNYLHDLIMSVSIVPLPDPLPASPPVPMTNLDRLPDYLHATKLSQEEESHIYVTLLDYVNDENQSHRELARNLAREFLKRDTLISARLARRLMDLS